MSQREPPDRRPHHHRGRAPGLRPVAARGELPADTGVGARQDGLGARVARLVCRRRAADAPRRRRSSSTVSCPGSSATSPTCPRGRSSTGPTTASSPRRCGPLREHVKGKGAFALRIGPPVVVNRWSAATVKDAIADQSVRSLTQVPADTVERAPARPCVETLRPPGVPASGRRGRVCLRPAAVRLPAPARGSHRGGPARRAEPAVAPQHQEGDEGRRRGEPRRPPPTCPTSTASTSRPPSATTSPRDRWRTSSGCSTAMLAEDPDRIRLYLAHHERRPGRRDLVAATIWVRSDGTPGTPTARPRAPSARCAARTPCSGR